MSGHKALCISHGEDADGLICAALLRRMRGASPILVSYDDFLEALEGVEPPVDELYICDLNIREALLEEILRINGFASITIVDHHASVEGLLESLVERGVKVLHDVRDCTSVILYDHFREELGREAGRLAAYAAWADQFEDGPIASRLLWDYDRQFVQHEALILAHAIARTQEPGFWRLIVDELSGLAFPHAIPGVVEAALAHLRESSEMIARLPAAATRLGRLAYVEAEGEEPIGTVANLIVDALGVEVGLCYKVKAGSRVSVSLRSRRGLAFHLGEITRRVAARRVGFGGGHKRASGASLPLQSLKGFIDDVTEELSE
jgi:single-stranded-DNA-specific exonuclease